MSTKQCTKCKRVLPLDAFLVTNGRGRRKSECKECGRERNRLYKQLVRSAGLASVHPIDAEPRVWLTPGPLVAAMLRHADRLAGEHDEPETRVCNMCNIDPRRLYAWKSGETKRVELDHADKVLIGLGLLWWEVWDPALFPEVAAIFEPVEQVAA